MLQSMGSQKIDAKYSMYGLHFLHQVWIAFIFS